LLTAKLHPYQEADVDRALARGSMLLAYEWGLGKTVMALAMCEDLFGQGLARTAVIVCLSGLKTQWAMEIANKTDVDTKEIVVKMDGEKQHIRVPTEEFCVVIDGTPEKRKAQYERIAADPPDYIVMSAENVVNDWSFVRKVPRDVIILDEAAIIKNFRAQRTRKIKRLTAPYRYGMTATPIDNGKPEELFSIMQWVDEDVLGRFDLFDKTYIERDSYGGVLMYKNLPVLHQKMKSVLSRKRREDDDVKDYLPEVTHKPPVEVKADAKLRHAYEFMARELLTDLQAMKPSVAGFDLYAHYHDGNEDMTEAGKIMAKMVAIDQLLDHPDLVVQSALNYEDSTARRAAGEVKATWPGSAYAYDVWQSGLLDDVTDSPKLTQLVEIVETIMLTSEKNKVIVFSQYPEMLEIIQDALPAWGSVTYHGGKSNGEKAAAKAKFGSDETCRLFLSSHAGGVGTDLNMANYLINFDAPWSPGMQDQINGRHVRASSKFKNVYIIDLVIKNTTSVWKHDKVNQKRTVSTAILDKVGHDSFGRVENNVATLRTFLEHTLPT
jgi:SNF2 family DNA or RNA helicase